MCNKMIVGYCNWHFRALLFVLITISLTPVSTKKSCIKNQLSQIASEGNSTILLPACQNNTLALSENDKKKSKRKSLRKGIKDAARKGMEAMHELYDTLEPTLKRNCELLNSDDPGAKLSLFSQRDTEDSASDRAAYAALYAAKKLKESFDVDYLGLGRQTQDRLSLRRTALEGLCPSRDPPPCLPASRRYRTHDGTCNNDRNPFWGSAQLPFHRFLLPDYSDGVDSIRLADDGGSLPSARFISLVVHGARHEEAPVTMMLAQWGQFIDHDLTATAQPRSINGSVPRCCGSSEIHPNCLTIRVPEDDPWLAPLNVRCLEFLRSAPAQRRDCMLSWREQINQATSYLDASTVYASNARSADSNRQFRDGLLIFGRGNPRDDVCQRGGLASHCVRPGDQRSGEQPGLMAMHTVWVGEHNRISRELGRLNAHWSDEKLYQEARRIIGAMVQHITYREFLPLVLGRDVCRLFGLTLETSGYFDGYDPKINPTVANSFGSAAFRFGHSLVQGSLMRSDRNHNFMINNVTLHEEFGRGDMGSAGSLQRLLRGLLMQRAMKRDEFISAELTNHLFQSNSFPFGLDLAAINIQRGRDHGLPSYTAWRAPCGLSQINSWHDLINIYGPESTSRIRQAYRSVHDIDLFVGGLAERPVLGGIIGPTLACILAQQFSNLRKGDRFWYENAGFESSFTPAQLASIRQVTMSQVICRQVNGGTLQPHAFLPPDMVGNERQHCGEASLSHLDLIPWTERDPLNKQHDLPIPAFSLKPQLIASSPTINEHNKQKQKDKNKNKKKRKRPNNSTPSPGIVATKTIAAKNQSVSTADTVTVPVEKSKVNDKLSFEDSEQPIVVSEQVTEKTKIDTKIESVKSSRATIFHPASNTVHIAITWGNHGNKFQKPIHPVLDDKISSIDDESQFYTKKPIANNSPFSYDPHGAWTHNDIPIVTPPYDIRNTVKWKPKPSYNYNYVYATQPPPKRSSSFNFNSTIPVSVRESSEEFTNESIIPEKTEADPSLSPFSSSSEEVPASPSIVIYHNNRTYIAEPEPRQSSNKIESEDDSSQDPKPQSREQKKEIIAFVPLKIINSADRPDDWTMIQGPPKKPLPLMPEITSAGADVSSELPTPFSLL